MERISEPVLIGDLIDEALSGFWKPNTKEEEAEKFKGRKDVYTDIGGIVRCRKCNVPRMFYLAEAQRWLPCACRCAGQEDEEDFASKVAELRRESGIIGRYEKATFDRAERTESNDAVFESCMRYAVHWDKIRGKGMGIYLHGASGTGKTYLAACIGNFLLEAGIQVLFVNVNSILSEIRYSYSQRGSELPIVRKYTNAELVIFDDIGTEKYNAKSEALSFAQDKLFQIIDGRYVRQNPTIFTSNYTLEQLVNERGILVKTVDRISEMSTRKFEMRGRPRRQELQRITGEDCPF